MAVEIERKYRVAGDGWRDHVMNSQPLRQGYLGEGGKAAVRVRIAGDAAVLTIKSSQAGMSRAEYEYPLPLDEARELLDTLCGRVISKVRHKVEYAGHLWEVDVFEGENAGLVLAEIELSDEATAFEQPPWLGAEVTDDKRYSNHALSMQPWRSWGLP